jgi:hypothetical protein
MGPNPQHAPRTGPPEREEARRLDNRTDVLGDARKAGSRRERLLRWRRFIAVRLLEWQALNVRSVPEM